jgi:general secretion pathway protein C
MYASLSSWYGRLNGRERLFLAAGAAALLLFVIYLTWPEEEAEGIELTGTVPAAQPAVAPPPMPIMSVPPPLVPAMPGVAAADPAGLVLRGVMGGGGSGGAAIVAGSDGVERVVRVGRDLAPGMTLRAIGVRHAIASSPAGDVRLELGKPGASLLARPPAPAAASAIAPPGAASAQREILELRLGLQPVRSNGRISGFSIRPGPVPQRLSQAGLQPGDVISKVNGSELDEERLMELSWEMSNAGRTEIEFVRNGRRMKAQVPSLR